ncbi:MULTISPECIES: zinc ribbon-containing protein [unclassified Agarivorans]|uniref:zinc ribbon-containing protein n=1 Tax=unclassified Agarivorans TaxID=2636026 RepID=UPI003D7EEE7F
MPKRIKAYQAFVKDLEQRIQQSGEVSREELSKLIDATQEYLHAASDLSKDEWQLIANYVRRDLSDWRDDYRRAYEESPSMEMLKQSIWYWLAKLSDPSQVEWHELLGDLQHQGIYQRGELIGLGVLECAQCGEHTALWHPTIIDACPKCQGERFYRHPMSHVED